MWLLSLAKVRRIALFSRLLRPKLDCFPSFSWLTSEQDLSAEPIPYLLRYLGRQQKQGHKCKAASQHNARQKSYLWVHWELRTCQINIHRVHLYSESDWIPSKNVKNDFQILFRYFGSWIWWYMKFHDNPLHCNSCITIQFFNNILPNFRQEEKNQTCDCVIML